jgi:hypothetical protein
MSSNSATTEEASDSVATMEQNTMKFVRWTVAVRLYVAKDLFRYVQFVNREVDIEFGSSIQKVVCAECNIPQNDQLQYWNTAGCDEVLLVLRRKRQAVSTGIKERFRSKYKCMDVLVDSIVD